MNRRLVLPNVNGLRDDVLRECHHSKLTIHPGGNKMYRDMRQTYYWEGMKRDVGKFISKCMNCQLVKAKQKSLVDCYNHWKFPNGNVNKSQWISSMVYQELGQIMIVFG